MSIYTYFKHKYLFNYNFSFIWYSKENKFTKIEKIKSIPLNLLIAIDTQKKILLPSITCPKFRIYGIGDQFHFGKTKDLINFWNCEFYEDGIHSLVKDKNVKNYVINGTAIFSEIYLLSKFLERNNYNLKWTLEDYWNVIKNNFCIFLN